MFTECSQGQHDERAAGVVGCLGARIPIYPPLEIYAPVKKLSEKLCPTMLHGSKIDLKRYFNPF